MERNQYLNSVKNLKVEKVQFILLHLIMEITMIQLMQELMTVVLTTVTSQLQKHKLRTKNS